MKRPVADAWMESLLSATQQMIDPAAAAPSWTEVAAEWEAHIARATGSTKVSVDQVGYYEDQRRVMLRLDCFESWTAECIMADPSAIARAAGLPDGSVTARQGTVGREWRPRLTLDVRLPKPHECGYRCVEYIPGGVGQPRILHDHSADAVQPARAAFAPPPKPKTCHCTHAPSAHRDRPGIGCTHRGCLCLDTPTLAAQESPCPARSAPASPPASRSDPPSPSSPATSSPTSLPQCGRRRYGWLGTMRGGSW